MPRRPQHDLARNKCMKRRRINRSRARTGGLWMTPCCFSGTRLMFSPDDFPPSTPCYFAPGRGAGSGRSEEQQEPGTIVIARAVIFAASLTYWPSPVASSVPASGAVKESICIDMDICIAAAAACGSAQTRNTKILCLATLCAFYNGRSCDTG